ncbi:MAG: nucleoside triphosphate pyrophosphohydrolase, partial [Vicinamibacterales bacterium]
MPPPPENLDQSAGAAFQRLVEIMARLRGPGGCPWDHEQTLESLRRFVLEETYEVLDAIDAGDVQALRGEIGDFLFEGVFLARIAEDDGHFTVADSLRAICEKLIRRHPHVFATTEGVSTPQLVLEQWESIKAREQVAAGESRSLLRGLPKALPALLHAYEIGARVATVGFDWAGNASVLDKIEEEVAELRQAVQHESPARAAEEMGDLLFTMANLSRKLGIDPE